MSRVQIYSITSCTGLKVKIAQTSSPISLCQIKSTTFSLQRETCIQRTHGREKHKRLAPTEL